MFLVALSIYVSQILGKKTGMAYQFTDIYWKWPIWPYISSEYRPDIGVFPPDTSVKHRLYRHLQEYRPPVSVKARTK